MSDHERTEVIRTIFGHIVLLATMATVPFSLSMAAERPRNERALRTKLSQLMADPALRDELARRGRERVLAHYTQAQVAAKTYQVYCELLGRA